MGLFGRKKNKRKNGGRGTWLGNFLRERLYNNSFGLLGEDALPGENIGQNIRHKVEEIKQNLKLDE